MPDIEETWHPYFTAHGDPFVVTDVRRPGFTKVCTVDTSPDDYGQSNCFKLSAANDLYDALLEAVEPLLAHPHEECNMSAASWQWFCKARAALAKYRGEGHQFIPDI